MSVRYYMNKFFLASASWIKFHFIRMRNLKKKSCKFKALCSQCQIYINGTQISKIRKLSQYFRMKIIYLNSCLEKYECQYLFTTCIYLLRFCDYFFIVNDNF